LAKAIALLLEKRHLLGKPIDDAMSKVAFATYLTRLDSNKLFLRVSDRDKLSRFEDKIDDALRSGNLELAHEGQKIFVERVGVVEAMVSTLLAAPMNHSDEEFVELDPKKLDPAASDEELETRWRQRLELEVLERLAAMEERLTKAAKPGAAAPAAGAGSDSASAAGGIKDIPATPELRDAKVRADLAKTYASRFTRLKSPGNLDAAADLLNAITATFDPHTDYLPPADKANFDIAMTGSLEGIGASLRERDDFIEVSELIPGGAAFRQGKLAPGDLILAVQQPDQDPVDIMDMRLDEAVQLIRGPKGTVVRLRVRKPDGHEEVIEIKRDVIAIEEAYARGAVIQRKGGLSYGYIYLPSFYGGDSTPRKASSDVHKLLGALSQKKVAGIVLALRGNGGGLLRDSVQLAGELIDQGPIVQVRDHEGEIEVLRDTRPGVDTSAPMLILVDAFSASASEILAGAMQDYRRAVIVGLGPTHGKGTVQAVMGLDRDPSATELGVLKITVEQFFRISGSSTQREGVTPDISLPNPTSYIKSGERELEHAIEWTKIAPAAYTAWKPNWDLERLRKQSADRVAKNPVFAKITATAELRGKIRDHTRFPLARAAWEAGERQEKAALAAVAPELDKAPPKLSVRPVAEMPAKQPDARLNRWTETLSRDPWLDECISILAEMK
jgi:carboxyl-terminal processing protease